MINFPNVAPPVTTPVHHEPPGPKPTQAIAPLVAPPPVNESEASTVLERRKERDRRKQNQPLGKRYERRQTSRREDEGGIDIEV